MNATEIHALILHTREHVILVAISALLGSCIALPLGVITARSKFHTAILATLGVLYTLPSLALFALLVPLLGLGAPTAVTVLTLYATVFLTRSTALALRGLPATVVENAKALGATATERLLRVELPMASPALIAGLRITCIMLIATAAIAAWIDGGGLGVLLFEGLRQDNMRRVITGSITVAVLAITVDGALALLERRLRQYL